MGATTQEMTVMGKAVGALKSCGLLTEGPQMIALINVAFWFRHRYFARGGST